MSIEGGVNGGSGEGAGGEASSASEGAGAGDGDFGEGMVKLVVGISAEIRELAELETRLKL